MNQSASENTSITTGIQSKEEGTSINHPFIEVNQFRSLKPIATVASFRFEINQLSGKTNQIRELQNWPINKRLTRVNQ